MVPDDLHRSRRAWRRRVPALSSARRTRTPLLVGSCLYLQEACEQSASCSNAALIDRNRAGIACNADEERSGRYERRRVDNIKLPSEGSSPAWAPRQECVMVGSGPGSCPGGRGFWESIDSDEMVGAGLDQLLFACAGTTWTGVNQKLAILLPHVIVARFLSLRRYLCDIGKHRISTCAQCRGPIAGNST
jgi:hypothetical protein